MRQILLVAALLIPAQLAAGGLPKAWRAALDEISADSLRGHASFLASDLLEGRDTPSKGLNIAAEYIAAQFRRAGLEAGGDNGYFQEADWKLRQANTGALRFSIHAGDRIIRLAGAQLAGNPARPFEIREAPVSVAKVSDAADLEAGQVDGKVVAVLVPDVSKLERSRRRQVFLAYRRLIRTMASRAPALVVFVDPGRWLAARAARPRLIDPENPPQDEFPSLAISDREVAQILSAHPAGVRVSASAAAPVVTDVRLRNVIGVLRGSDEKLRDTAVLLTAHYDHLGMRPSGNGDRIYNGANDDASGTISVIEVARVLARLEKPPKRSIVFITFFGEEKGMLGSGYYVRHPVFPLADTVADINLEQVGRTDSAEGPEELRAAVTGFDYSTVGRILAAAGRQTDIEVYKDPANNDRFFGASDNIRFAEKGVPAHTVTVAFEFPDYHRVGDHWTKMNFENQAAITRMVALGVLLIAGRESPPAWNRDNPKTSAYRQARRRQP